MNIIQALDDPRFFRPLFKDPSTWLSWRVFLKCLFNIPISDRRERRIFKACTGLKRQPRGRVKESYCIISRRGGKSFTSALIAVYLSCFKDWSKSLTTGERGSIFIIANDKSQAKIVKNYVSGILNSQPTFRKLIRKDLSYEIELTNGVDICIKTSNFRSVRGWTLLACILEEIAFFRSDFSANPDVELLNAIRPALATVEDSLLLGISTPYSRSGVLYEQHKAHYGKSGGAFIWKARSQQMNPTLDKNIIKQAKIDDPQRAAAEWESEFRSDLEMVLGLDLIESLVIPKRLELPPLKDVVTHGFTDSSGGRGDSFTLGISHKDHNSGRIILDCIRERRPPFDPVEVVQEYAKTLKSYGLSSVTGDKYSGSWCSLAFQKEKIQYMDSELTKSEIYQSFLPLCSSGQVELLDHKKMISQLVSLERKTRSGGRDLVDNFLGHDDIANVCAGACVLAGGEEAIDFPYYLLDGTLDGDLLESDEEIMEELRQDLKEN